MRRLRTILLLLLVLALLAIAPATAEEPILIAVPSDLTYGLTLDVVVLTGRPTTSTWFSCIPHGFPPGEYQVFQTAIVEPYGRAAARVDGVIATADVRGNLGSFVDQGFCHGPGPDYTLYRIFSNWITTRP
jgi:hypothetical protein